MNRSSSQFKATREGWVASIRGVRIVETGPVSANSCVIFLLYVFVPTAVQDCQGRSQLIQGPTNFIAYLLQYPLGTAWIVWANNFIIA